MFSNPEKNILKLGLREGMRVADLGAGTGAYSIAASKCVGHTGHVFAVEVQKDLVKKLESEIKEALVSNVECIWGDIEKKHGTKMANESMDAVVISNVLFQTDDKLGLIDEAKRILKKGGKVLFVDWIESFGGSGPSKMNVVTEDIAIDLFTKRGFKLQERITTSEHHYGIIFIHE